MAFNLGLTIQQLNDLDAKEYMGWVEYFDKRPMGYKEDYRTSLLMQTTYQGSKKLKITEYFPTLKIISDQQQSNESLRKNPFINFLRQKDETFLKFLDLNADIQ